MCTAVSVAQPLTRPILTTPRRTILHSLFVRICFLLLATGKFNQVLQSRNFLQHSRAMQPGYSFLAGSVLACMNILGICHVAHMLSWICVCPGGNGLQLHEHFRCPVPDWPLFSGLLGGKPNLNLVPLDLPSGVSYSDGRNGIIPGKEDGQRYPQGEAGCVFSRSMLTA